MQKAKSLSAFLVLFLLSAAPCAAQTEKYDIAFSTILGGQHEDSARGVAVHDRYTLIVGGSGGTCMWNSSYGYNCSPNAPVTNSILANCPVVQDPLVPSDFQGIHDGLVILMDNRTAKPLWCRLIGGPNYDRFYGAAFDDLGNIYVAGRAGYGFPIVGNTFQKNFEPTTTTIFGPYGHQNGVVVQLDMQGRVKRSSYLSFDGTMVGVRNLDSNPATGELYVYAASENDDAAAKGIVSTNAFQPHHSGSWDGLVVKIAPNLSRISCATYFGGSGGESITPSVAYSAADDTILIYGETTSPDLPVTGACTGCTPAGKGGPVFNGPGSPDPTDMYLAKISDDCRHLLFATYIGGTGQEFSETNGVAVSDNGDIVVSGLTTAADFPRSSQFAQASYGGKKDALLAKLSRTGSLISIGTLGGRENEYDGGEGVTFDEAGNIYVTGGTYSYNFPVTNGSVKNGGLDIFATKLSPDLSELRFSSYYGSAQDDRGRAVRVNPRDGSWWIAGVTVPSTSFPLKHELQSSPSWGPLESFFMKLERPLELSYSARSTPAGFTYDISLSGGIPGEEQVFVLGTKSGKFKYVTCPNQQLGMADPIVANIANADAAGNVNFSVTLPRPLAAPLLLQSAEWWSCRASGVEVVQ